MSARPIATTSRCSRPTWSSSSASRSSPSPPRPASRRGAPPGSPSSNTRSCRRSSTSRRRCPTGVLVTDPLTLRRGDAKAAIAAAPRRLTGRMRIGGQEHFYLEGQVALAMPGEDDEVTVYSSTQHPTEVQHMVAKVLGVPRTRSPSRSAAWAAASAARRPRATCSPACARSSPRRPAAPPSAASTATTTWSSPASATTSSSTTRSASTARAASRAST